MKLFKLFITSLITAICLPALAQEGASVFAVAGSQYNASAVTNYAIVSRHTKLPRANAVVTFLSATSDALATTVKGSVQFFKSVNASPVPVGFTNLTTTNFVTSTNGFGAGTNVVIEHIQPANGLLNATPTYEYGIVSSVTTPAIATNITVNPVGGATVTNFVWQVVLAVATTTATDPGDTLFAMAPSGFIPVGVGTLNVTGAGITTSGREDPLLLQINGGTNATINAVSGYYTQ